MLVHQTGFSLNQRSMRWRCRIRDGSDIFVNYGLPRYSTRPVVHQGYHRSCIECMRLSLTREAVGPSCCRSRAIVGGVWSSTILLASTFPHEFNKDFESNTNIVSFESYPWKLLQHSGSCMTTVEVNGARATRHSISRILVVAGNTSFSNQCNDLLSRARCSDHRQHSMIIEPQIRSTRYSVFEA